MNAKKKKRSGVILAVSAGIFVITLSISSFFLMQIIGRMNRSANESLLTSSRVISGGLNDKITLDRELLFTLADLLALEQESTVGETLREYASSTDFFRFAYLNMQGEGVDSEGGTVRASDFPFDEIALSRGAVGLSAPYHGPSGRIQITYQAPVFQGGRQTGAVYADRVINDYNLPSLFSFHSGAGSAYVVDGGGNFIIKSRGTASEADIYNYLAAQGNGEAVLDTLRRVIAEQKSGTLGIVNQRAQSLLGFLPVESLEGCYLITVIPRTVLQQEATPIIVMLFTMFGLLLLSGLSVAALFAGRQVMKQDVDQWQDL